MYKKQLIKLHFHGFLPKFDSRPLINIVGKAGRCLLVSVRLWSFYFGEPFLWVWNIERILIVICIKNIIRYIGIITEKRCVSNSEATKKKILNWYWYFKMKPNVILQKKI